MLETIKPRISALPFQINCLPNSTIELKLRGLGEIKRTDFVACPGIRTLLTYGLSTPDTRNKKASTFPGRKAEAF
jgi:hypothetical protein